MAYWGNKQTAAAESAAKLAKVRAIDILTIAADVHRSRKADGANEIASAFDHVIGLIEQNLVIEDIAYAVRFGVEAR